MSDFPQETALGSVGIGPAKMGERKEGPMTYSPPTDRLVSRDPKISALSKALLTVAATAGPEDFVSMASTPKVRRFVAIFKARNRRTRVLMKRALLKQTPVLKLYPSSTYGKLG